MHPTWTVWNTTHGPFDQLSHFAHSSFNTKAIGQVRATVPQILLIRFGHTGRVNYNISDIIDGLKGLPDQRAALHPCVGIAICGDSSEASYRQNLVMA